MVYTGQRKNKREGEKMRKTIHIIATVLIVSILVVGTAMADFRADLVAMQSLDAVWTLDAYHTAVWRDETVQEDAFIEEFLLLCEKYGGIKVQAQKKDDLTGQIATSWAPIEIKFKKNWMGRGAYKYQDPATGKEMFFPSADGNVQYQVAGQIETTKKFVELGEHLTKIYGFVFAHTAPQRFTYKIKGITAADLETIPPEGDLYRIDPVSRINGGNLFQYLLALSKAQGGQHTWVVAQGGNLEEVNSFDAYNYLIGALNTPFPKQWFFIHKGAQPFTVKRTTGGGTDELQMFHREPVGLAYIKLASGANKPIADVQPSASNLATGIEAKLAQAATLTQANTTSRNNPTDLYEVLYHGGNTDGSRVTVQKFYAPEGTTEKRLLTSNDYRVVNGQVFKVENDMIANSMVPEEVEALIPGVAKDTQATGSATAIYQDYMVVGRALRDQAKCKVEIKVFKNNTFVTSRQINGCNP